jgi:2-keto-4-pentenoate hydratase/2-oxohepta-3-ene-1,7-dioic acid hydratase in catechol pathway
MKFVTIDSPPDGRAGVLVGDEVLDFAQAARVLPLAAFVPTTVAAILAAGADGLEIVRRVIGEAEKIGAALGEVGALSPFATARLRAPLPRPGIVLSHGRAYLSHLKEMQKTDTPKVAENPTAFLKNGSAIVGPRQPIVLPPQCPDMVDFEGEFSIVFGRRCHAVTKETAMACVAGYTIVNDVSARNWVEHFQSTGDPEVNRMGKQLHTFCPMGPVVVTKDEIPDPHALRMTAGLNGEVFQDCTTDDLIWRVEELIAYFSRWYPFEAGDVLTTGSPPGVGYGRNPKVFMKPGDVVRVTVTGIGTLENPVVAG